MEINNQKALRFVKREVQGSKSTPIREKQWELRTKSKIISDKQREPF